MRFFFLFLIVTSFASAADEAAPPALSKEEEARKAAEVLGATYTPTRPDEALIDFSDSQMNDEEKEVVMANYERTKVQYKEDAGDSLFEKISKAYVRNLDKILTKKKPE